MTLTEILNEIKTQKGFQDADVSPQVINGRIPGQEIARTEALAIAKRQAVDRIEELLNLYHRAVYQNSAVILVTGDAAGRQDFMARAAKDEALCVEADTFFKRIAAGAQSRMGPQSVMSVTVGQSIVAALATGIGQFSPGSFNQYPKMPGEYIDAVLRTSEEIVPVVKATAKPCTDIPLSITWLERNVANMAYEQQFDSPPLAIVVSIDDPADLPDWQRYFLPRSPSVTVDVTSQDIEAALASAKESLVAKMGT